VTTLIMSMLLQNRRTCNEQGHNCYLNMFIVGHGCMQSHLGSMVIREDPNIIWCENYKSLLQMLFLSHFITAFSSAVHPKVSTKRFRGRNFNFHKNSVIKLTLKMLRMAETRTSLMIYY
jgi:hypothetical protein